MNPFMKYADSKIAWYRPVGHFIYQYIFAITNGWFYATQDQNI